ncbi:MAG TPA: MarR family transcriptional regulator [Caulobacteraceae bacterium]|jgi:DNA-binding MarR family transcriptional regulator|nr:MarR family transcriptional regulator [Caulobacteraceae bacterium]
MEPTNITWRRRTMGGLLRVVEERMRARVYAQMAEVGFPDIRPAHSSLLRNIAEDGSRVSDLAQRAQMTKQSMSYLADSLEAAGYVAQTPDPTDGRAKRVRLTNKGRAAGEAMVKLSAEMEAEFGELIGRTQMVRLRRLLEQLADRLA